jgi:hypothetical protein
MFITIMLLERKNKMAEEDEIKLIAYTLHSVNGSRMMKTKKGRYSRWIPPFLVIL